METKIVIYQENKTNVNKIVSITNKVKTKIISKVNMMKITRNKQTMYMKRVRLGLLKVMLEISAIDKKVVNPLLK